VQFLVNFHLLYFPENIKQMARVFKYILISLVIVIALLAFFWFFAPGVIIKSLALAGRSTADLKEYKTTVNGITWHYLEGGKGQKTLLILHGFGQSKDDWLVDAKALSHEYKLVIPDLPGFGKTRIPYEIIKKDTLVMDQMIVELDNFITTIGLDSFSICGLSMGGGIGISYSARYPKKVNKLIVLDPYGISFMRKSDFVNELDKGRNPMLPKTITDVDTLMELIFYKPKPLPYSFKKYILKKSLKDQELHTTMFNDQITNNGWGAYDKQLAGVSCPILVFWGRNDRVFDVSATYTVDSLAPNAEVVILDSCGHVSNMDRPDVVIPKISEFLKVGK
jgi:abhydrolase domain-containing protein 6